MDELQSLVELVRDCNTTFLPNCFGRIIELSMSDWGCISETACIGLVAGTSHICEYLMPDP